jgi:hypothetical protein
VRRERLGQKPWIDSEIPLVSASPIHELACLDRVLDKVDDDVRASFAAARVEAHADGLVATLLPGLEMQSVCREAIEGVPQRSA